MARHRVPYDSRMNVRFVLWLLYGASHLSIAALGSAGAWASTCPAVSSGYSVGQRVVFIVEDRTLQPPVRIEREVSGAKPASFEVLRRPIDDRGQCAGRQIAYGRDHKHVFHRWQVIPGADPRTYTFIEGSYARDKTAIYAQARRLTTRLDTFRILPAGYASDGRRHFFGDIVIEGRHFELLGDKTQVSRGYARTEQRVYHKGKALPGADPHSFELYKPEAGITRDRRVVYYDDQVIVGADPGTFMQVHGYTFKDRAGVYQQGRRLDGISPGSVRATEFGTYLVDDQSVFKAGVRLAGRDAASFVELQYPWSRDRHAAYYQESPVPDVDLSSFRTTDMDRAEDQNVRYVGPRKVCKFNPSDPQVLPLCS